MTTYTIYIFFLCRVALRRMFCQINSQRLPSTNILDITALVGLNVFIKDNQQAYCLRVVLQQIYMRDIHGILQNVHICQHKKYSHRKYTVSIRS